MNKKGFTLMELLAVIVILSVLILLAMPAVLRLMENAKKNAFITESQEILKIANTAYADKIAKGETVTEITLEELKTEGYTDKDFSSTSGKVEFERDANGVITSKLTYSNGTYSVSEATIDTIKSKTIKGEIKIRKSMEFTTAGEIMGSNYYRTTNAVKVNDGIAIYAYFYDPYLGGGIGCLIAINPQTSENAQAKWTYGNESFNLSTYNYNGVTYNYSYIRKDQVNLNEKSYACQNVNPQSGESMTVVCERAIKEALDYYYYVTE